MKVSIMTEHETTLAIIRKDYREKVSAWFRTRYHDHDQEFDFPKLFENCTTLQLRALCQLIDKGTDFKILRSNPLDHLAVTFSGIYVGIEVDGYTHS